MRSWSNDHRHRTHTFWRNKLSNFRFCCWQLPEWKRRMGQLFPCFLLFVFCYGKVPIDLPISSRLSVETNSRNLRFCCWQLPEWRRRMGQLFPCFLLFVSCYGKVPTDLPVSLRRNSLEHTNCHSITEETLQHMVNTVKRSNISRTLVGNKLVDH